MRNPNQVLNTEDKKKSSVLDSIKHKYQGGPSLLHDIISKDGVDISAVNHMSAESIKGICEKCNILTSHKSVERMKIDIQAWYESLLIGSCPYAMDLPRLMVIQVAFITLCADMG